MAQCIESWESMIDHGNFYTFINNAEYLLMQFTGLTDKNGIDIYDGDIIDDFGVIQYVEYSEGLQQFVLRLNKTSGSCSLHGMCKHIGNIHQNPELLNEPKTKEENK